MKTRLTLVALLLASTAASASGLTTKTSSDTTGETYNLTWEVNAQETSKIISLKQPTATITLTDTTKKGELTLGTTQFIITDYDPAASSVPVEYCFKQSDWNLMQPEGNTGNLKITYGGTEVTGEDQQCTTSVNLGEDLTFSVGAGNHLAGKYTVTGSITGYLN